MHILIIDVGSSSVRALLFNEKAQLATNMIARRTHQMITKDGAGFFPILNLQTCIEQCIDEILQHPLASNIQAVGLTTFVGNLVGLNAEGEAITPLYTYAETRSRDELHLLQSIYTSSNAYYRTGCPHHTAYAPSLLSWLKRTDEILFKQVEKWVDLGSYLYRKWFSIDAPMSYSCASWTGLLNRVNLQWDTVWLDALELPIERFPHLADYHDVLVGLSSVYASRWPKLANVPFYLAIGDGAAANVGVGALDEQAIAITIGTTSAARMITSRLPDVSNGLWSYRLDKHHHLLGGALSAGGNIYKWLQSVLRLPEDADALVLAQRNKSHGLSFVPSLAGERSPRWNPFITGQIQGLRLETTAIDILQAALEGVALQLAAVIEQMPSTSSTKIYASGGALSASIAWPAIITDILGKEIYLIDFVETTARGCACLVLSHFGKRVLTEFERLPTKIVTPSS